MVVESAVALMNSYPVLWMVYAFAITLPLVAFVSCIFWPKESDSVSRRKKTDEPSPDVKDKDSISDSGIEASGDRSHFSSEERDIFPEALPKGNGKSHDRSQTRPDKSHDVTVISVPVTEGTTIGNGSKYTHNGNETGDSHTDAVESELNSDRCQNEINRSLTNGVEDECDDDDDVIPARWVFPPVLEDFDLMESDMDPSQLEEIFADDRLLELVLRIEPGVSGLGISIVGGSGSPNGDLPILVKRVLQDSLAERDGRLKSGDEIIAVNETLLVGMSKEYAINVLSKMEGTIRLLILRDE